VLGVRGLSVGAGAALAFPQSGEIASAMNQPEHVHGLLPDLVNEAVTADDQLADRGIFEFRNDPAALG
jgi:hypothetical protein